MLALKILAGVRAKVLHAAKSPGPIALLTQGPTLAHSEILFQDPTHPVGCQSQSGLVTYLEGWREGASLFIHPASLREKVCCLLLFRHACHQEPSPG